MTGAPARRGAAKLLAAALLLVAAADGAAAQVTRQSQADFEAALTNETTAPSFILVTIVDGRTGAEKTGCILAPFLIGAIHRERHLAYSPAEMAVGLRIAEAQSDHRFVFRDPAALRNVQFDQLGEGNEAACRLIRGGRQAYMADITGQILEGRP
jgi:hypothetical protein